MAISPFKVGNILEAMGTGEKHCVGLKGDVKISGEPLDLKIGYALDALSDGIHIRFRAVHK